MDNLKTKPKNRVIYWILYLILWFLNIILSFVLGFLFIVIDQSYLRPIFLMGELTLFMSNYKFLSWLLNKEYRWLTILLSSIPQLAFTLNMYILSLLRTDY